MAKRQVLAAAIEGVQFVSIYTYYNCNQLESRTQHLHSVDLPCIHAYILHIIFTT